MSEPIRNKKMDSITAPTPQNTPANAAPISSRAQQPGVSSIQEEGMERTAASLLASNPALVQMMQAKLTSLVGRSSGYIESLPAHVRRRVDALKGLQKLHSDLEGKFQQEVLDLEKSYFYGVPPPKRDEPKEESQFKCFQDLYERRAMIVKGEGPAPTDEEVELGQSRQAAQTEETDQAGQEKKPAEVEVTQQSKDDEGIPEFWLTAMKNQPSLGELITDKDEAVLKHLKDIRMEYLDEPGFRLLFEFEKNEYISKKTWISEDVEEARKTARQDENAARKAAGKKPLPLELEENPEPLIPNVLTKTYYYRSDPGYFGDFIYDSAHATMILWENSAANPTIRFEKRKQRHKSRNETRFVKKEVQTQSFFNFFDPPQAPEDDVGSEIEERLEFDYQLGEDIKEKLIPRAVDWFTGEALRYEELDDFDEGEFEDEDDDEEEDDLSDDRDDDDDTDDEADGGKPKQEAAECKQS